MEQVGREVRRIRQERGLSQGHLARSSGVDRATLNQLEGGRRSPTIDTLEKLAGTLAVEVADFFPRAQPDLFDAAAKSASDAREAEAAGAKLIRLSDEGNTQLLERAREGDTESLEAEAAAMEERYQRMVREQYDAQDVFYSMTAGAYATQLAALAVARGGGLEEVRAAILRALEAREQAHAGVES
jgi:transcriptional regulator with XRE-family HTH domain